MDTILPALLVVTILLLASLFIGRSSFTSFQVLGDSFQDAEERSLERIRSDIIITSVSSAGPNVDVDVRNDGATQVVDFSRMDILVQYRAGSTTYNKYITFTTESSPQPDDTWRAVSVSDDVINPGVLNTGETLAIRLRLSPAPGAGSHWLQVTTELGISAESFFN